MSEQPLDLARSARLVRQHWRAVCAIAALGLVAGVVYTELNPPVLTSTALVRIASPKDAYSGGGATALVAIASSDPVLSLAQPHIQPLVTKQTLQNELTVNSRRSGILAIGAQGQSADQAKDTANAVATAFVVRHIHEKPERLDGCTDAAASVNRYRSFWPLPSLFPGRWAS